MSEEESKQKDNDNSVEKREESDTVDPDSVGELADALDIEDPEERKQLIAKFSQITSSPVPPPKVLKGYEKVVDGGAKWLMEYTKAEQLHRHKMDRKELSYYSAGQIFGFILGLIGIGGGLYLALTGATWFGFAAFFTSLVSLVGLFVYNKREESKKDS
ncbi:DUF2335 domain-containing protein [Fodinibius halophilus]|uniref:DUF2335 domain-containing protein n=1 Tax=Fodinibius halophilus TaxID=1736908 RepID=A0A6M1TF78_9BACT|nr:DUF2335 domain-containing protein [Fodinibius halophilus]NGP89434.1 DUF2335 domain-containing protein [Fodinibius halophilus]